MKIAIKSKLLMPLQTAESAAIFKYLRVPPYMHANVIARTLLEDFCDKPIVIQSYCAVARLHGV
jgi:hypothetical protein